MSGKLLSHVLLLFLVSSALFSASVRAGGPSTAVSTDLNSTKYGLFGWLDNRSTYGSGWYPEPFRVDEGDIDNELRLDYEHDQGHGTVGHEVHAEVEKSFGVVTVEVEGFYNVGTEATGNGTLTQGFGNIDLGIRAPFWQYVSPQGTFDTTFGVGFELGIPTNSPVSKNTEIVPKMFNTTRIGEHFSFQTIVGVSYLLGSKPDGGTRTFEYGVVLGWAIDHDELPLPDVQRLIPEVEFVGESGIDHSTANTSNISVTLGLRANLNAIGAFQPRLGVGYILPVDRGSRDELTQGLIASLVFEY